MTRLIRFYSKRAQNFERNKVALLARLRYRLKDSLKRFSIKHSKVGKEDCKLHYLLRIAIATKFKSFSFICLAAIRANIYKLFASPVLLACNQLKRNTAPFGNHNEQ
ncbi:MAG TPA: hypothetical protein VG347_13275 [Verrucomicrobiae bacterium]|nr:hypothetical protein [Verrucomicrobiae bacterium]